VRPVFEDQQRSVNRCRVVGGNLQFVDGLVESRVRIDVRAEAHSQRLHEAGDLLLGEVERAVEAHVLDEMRQSALVFVFEDGTRIHDEANFGAPAGLAVRADVVAKAVRKRADRDERIDGNRLAERRTLNGCDRARLLCVGQGHGGGDRRDQKRQLDASAKRHKVIVVTIAQRPVVFLTNRPEIVTSG
jgi:hypothetical protein